MINFLDFDGVIIDSIDECYLVSKETYYGYADFSFNEETYKKQFYKFRGLVRPAQEYYCLHDALETKNNGSTEEIDVLFHRSVQLSEKNTKELFEKKFFFTRKLYQEQDLDAWVNMNPLTIFGKTLVGKENQSVYIVTTKNKDATIALLEYFNIKVAGIYANDEIKAAGDKGKLIKNIMDEKNISESIFVDDAVEHLDTVKDARVQCYFADWGYGENTQYPVYEEWNS